MSTRVVLDRAALDRELTSTNGPVAKDLTRRAISVDRAAKGLCPVDTGRLRSSINWRLAVDSRGLLAVIGTSVTYAPYQEFGTRHQPGKPFLRPALGASAR